jgi:hypothetical protein
MYAFSADVNRQGGQIRPENAKRFVAEMKSRKLHWTVPNDWMEREDEAIAEQVINQGKENLLDLKKAFQAGSLKAVRHV